MHLKLSPTLRKLVLHWGEMGTRWGINRSVGQIYALLYFTPGTLAADDIAETLSLARSNVSTSIRELQAWGVVRTVHELGDRRDRYVALEDVWETFQAVADKRRRRELDPTLDILRESLAEIEKGTKPEAYARERVRDMLELLGAAIGWHEEVRRLSPAGLRTLGKLAGKVGNIVSASKARSS